MRFRPNKFGKLKLPQEYKNELISTGDDHFIKLADMDGEEIEFQKLPQPALSKNAIMVRINKPTMITIESRYIVDQREL